MGRFPRTTDGKWFKLTAPEIDKMCQEAKVDYPVSEIKPQGDCPFHNSIIVEDKLTFVPPEEWNDWGRLPTYIREEDGRANLISSARLVDVFRDRKTARAVIIQVLSLELSGQMMRFLEETSPILHPEENKQ